jgi:hypothetical protein
MTVVGGERVATTEQAGAGPMNRQQRREHFERLCAMRADYARRGREDARSVIKIEAMIQWASRRLERAGAPLVIERPDGSVA